MSAPSRTQPDDPEFVDVEHDCVRAGCGAAALQRRADRSGRSGGHRPHRQTHSRATRQPWCARSLPPRTTPAARTTSPRSMSRASDSPPSSHRHSRRGVRRARVTAGRRQTASVLRDRDVRVVLVPADCRSVVVPQALQRPPVAGPTRRSCAPDESIAPRSRGRDRGRRSSSNPANIASSCACKDGVRVVSRVPRGATIRLPATTADGGRPGSRCHGRVRRRIRRLPHRRRCGHAPGVGLVRPDARRCRFDDVEITGATSGASISSSGDGAGARRQRHPRQPGRRAGHRAGASPRIAHNTFARNGLAGAAHGVTRSSSAEPCPLLQKRLPRHGFDALGVLGHAPGGLRRTTGSWALPTRPVRRRAKRAAEQADDGERLQSLGPVRNSRRKSAAAAWPWCSSRRTRGRTPRVALKLVPQGTDREAREILEAETAGRAAAEAVLSDQPARAAASTSTALDVRLLLRRDGVSRRREPV